MTIFCCQFSLHTRLFAFLFYLIGLSACDNGWFANSPPLYESRAQAYLEKRDISADLILRLVERRPLSEDESTMLSRIGDTAVLHLLASNPSLPQSLLKTLSEKSDEEVRWGIAYNPNSPPDILLSLRTAGRYSTMNEYLARNPQLPEQVLREMYRNHEANRVGFAMNPKCPPDLMREIAGTGSDLDRTWLAANANLPDDLIALLERDSSENVQRFLKQNAAYRRRGDAEKLRGDGQ